MSLARDFHSYPTAPEGPELLELLQRLRRAPDFQLVLMPRTADGSATLDLLVGEDTRDEVRLRVSLHVRGGEVRVLQPVGVTVGRAVLYWSPRAGRAICQWALEVARAWLSYEGDQRR